MNRRLSLCSVSLLALLVGGVACNSTPKESKEEAANTPPVAASVQARAALVTPTLGGSVLAVGEQQLELAVLENGSVLGLVYDERGALVADAQLPKVSVDLRTKGGGKPHVELGWQPERACLAGRAQLEGGLVAEPLDVSLELNGKLSKATLSDYAILPLARFGGSVLALGPHAVELVAQGNTVLAYVLEASGQARANADLSLQLELGGGAPLALAWDAQRGHYRGVVEGKLDLSAQPLRLTLSAAGKSYVGAVSSLRALAQARLDARAQASATASAQVAAPMLDASAKLAAPSASLKAAASAGSAKLAAGKLAASKAVSAKVSAKAPSLTVSKSASSSASVKKPSAKAGANVKAGASFSFGK